MAGEPVERSWCVVVPHHPTGARLARHRLADELADVVPSMLLADLVAVLAELVGNAVRHAEALPGGGGPGGLAAAPDPRRAVRPAPGHRRRGRRRAAGAGRQP